MNKILKLTAFLLFTIVCFSCTKEEPVENKEIVVSYSTIEGVWKKTSWRGEAMNPDLYLYLVLERRDNKFQLYSNLSSSSPLKRTGNYNLIVADYKPAIINGLYDYEGGYWSNDYFVSITGDEMTWVSVKDASDISVYTKCSELPSEIL